MEIRAKARRLKARHGELALIVVDYLQLMSGGGTAENRQLEVSEISRNLKILAREMEVPIVALSQLSRNLESRADKRPMLSDLRESGCLTADTRLVRADTDAEITLGELVERGVGDIPVWSLDERYRLVPGQLVRAFPSGVKDVYRLRLASGRFVDASANHPFLTVEGWKRVESLAVGDCIAATTRRRGRRADRAERGDVVPAAVWEHVRRKTLPAAGDTAWQLASSVWRRCSTGRLAPVGHVARAACSGWPRSRAMCGCTTWRPPTCCWDRVVEITPLGAQPVFDATVEPHPQLRRQRDRRPQLARAGRRRRDVPLPRRGVQQRVSGQGLGRGDHRQAPFRADRHEAAGVPRSVHPLRQRRPRRLTTGRVSAQTPVAATGRCVDGSAGSAGAPARRSIRLCRSIACEWPAVGRLGELAEQPSVVRRNIVSDEAELDPADRRCLAGAGTVGGHEVQAVDALAAIAGGDEPDGVVDASSATGPASRPGRRRRRRSRRCADDGVSAWAVHGPAHGHDPFGTGWSIDTIAPPMSRGWRWRARMSGRSTLHTVLIPASRPPIGSSRSSTSKIAM